MCGRFTLLTDLSVIEGVDPAEESASEFQPSNNICPGQQIPAIIYDEKIRLVTFRWGLIPAWARDPSLGHKLINARAETIATKPSFRDAFKKRRCLIIADGFYEWSKGDKKTPYHFSLKSGASFCFAGLYEAWLSPEKKTIKTCAIITTDANVLLKQIHDRMPVIVPKDKEALWLDPGTRNPEEWAALLQPYPAEDMQMTTGWR